MALQAQTSGNPEQAQTSGNPETAFAAANCDGLELSTAIRKVIFDPHARELGDVVGAFRSDGWVWLRARDFNPKDYMDGFGRDDELPNGHSPVGCHYSPICEDGSFVVRPGDEDLILRKGIGSYKFERISTPLLRDDPFGATLTINSIQNSVERGQAREAFNRMKRQMPDYSEAEYMAVYADPHCDVLSLQQKGPSCRPNLLRVLHHLSPVDVDLVWPVDLTHHVLAHTIKSWGEWAQEPPSFDAIRSVANGMISAWHLLFGHIVRGELDAVGVANAIHRFQPEPLEITEKHLVDVRTGAVITKERRAANGLMSEKQWREILLFKREAPSGRVTLPQRPRGLSKDEKTKAAEETLRLKLRNKDITREQLTNPMSNGGMKRQAIADLIGVKSRTTAKKIVEEVLSEPEFAPKA